MGRLAQTLGRTNINLVPLADFKMTEIEILRIRQALLISWSADTSDIFHSAMHPSYGQCAPTAIVVQEVFGGEILKTKGWPTDGRHFYNRIEGVRHDFTAEQFTSNADYSHLVEYEDILSDSNEAGTEARACQVEALRMAFNQAFHLVRAS